LNVWNIAQARTVRQLLKESDGSGGVERAHVRSITAMTVSTDLHLLASGEGGELPSPNPPNTPGLEPAASLPSVWISCLVKIWDISNAGSEFLLAELEGHSDEVCFIHSFILNELKFFERRVNNRKIVNALWLWLWFKVRSLDFSVDRELLVSGSRDGSIRVWRVRDGSQLCWFTSNIAVLCARISDAKNVLVALGDKLGRRKLIMMQIVRARSRRTRPVGASASSHTLKSLHSLNTVNTQGTSPSADQGRATGSAGGSGLSSPLAQVFEQTFDERS